MKENLEITQASIAVVVSSGNFNMELNCSAFFLFFAEWKAQGFLHLHTKIWKISLFYPLSTEQQGIQLYRGGEHFISWVGVPLSTVPPVRAQWGLNFVSMHHCPKDWPSGVTFNFESQSPSNCLLWIHSADPENSKEGCNLITGQSWNENLKAPWAVWHGSPK